MNSNNISNQEKSEKVDWHKIDVVLIEYQSLRAEILQLMQNSSNTLNYGITGLAALYTACALIFAEVQTTGNPESSPKLFVMSVLVSLISPCVVAYVSRLWLLDTKSIIRIGKYIEWLEDKVEDMSGSKLLEWERCLHRKHYKFYNKSKKKLSN